MGAGLRLKEILRQKKMTIKQLSELTGISLNTLYSITKRDSTHIDSAILSIITKSLGITEDEFYGIKPLPPREIINEENHVELLTSKGQEWKAFSEYLEQMGYIFNSNPDGPNLYDEKSNTVYYDFLDTRSGKCYLISLDQFSQLMNNVNSYLKYNISELISPLDNRKS